MNGELSEDRGWVDHLGTGFSGFFCLQKSHKTPSLTGTPSFAVPHTLHDIFLRKCFLSPI